jgi:hypothetical protein
LKLRTGWIEKEVCCKGLRLELSTGHGLQESLVAMGLDWNRGLDGLKEISMLQLGVLVEIEDGLKESA